MKEKIQKRLAAIAGVGFTVIYCFFVNGFHLDSEFELTKAALTPPPMMSESDVQQENKSECGIADSTINAPSEKVNINTADAQTLETLKGIGEKMSQRIIKYREENGEFKQIEDIMKVKGIGKKTFLEFENDICVN